MKPAFLPSPAAPRMWCLSFDLKTQRLHDFAVALQLVAQKRGELVRARRCRGKAVCDERLTHVWNIERAYDLRVEAIHDRLGRAAADRHAEPVARVEARVARFSDRRDLG